MLRALGILVVLLVLGAGALFVAAGRTSPPVIAIDQPARMIGQTGTLQVTTTAPGARLSALTIQLEQNGRTLPLFSLDTPDAAAAMTQPAPDQVRIVRSIGKQQLPDLQSGPARIVVSASRKSFLDLRTVSAGASRDIQVRLEPPRLAVLSTHHYVNHGGSEMVIYRATPSDAQSGVRVGEIEYPGYPASGIGIAAGDPDLKVAFFALLHDQDLETPIAVFARDEAGNQATAPFVDRVFPKPFRKSRIEIDDRFLQRVVPQILQQSPGAGGDPSGGLLEGFLKINRELRRMNGDQISKVTAGSSPTRLWSGAFAQLGNSQVEASFADYRTYFYKGREVDQQVHLGFDLAVTAAVPVAAANSGKVLHADWLGIYGNCVIVDHGMGVSSLYAHLSSIDVKPGDSVTKGQVVGRSGMTGLAGGDHLHYTMLVNGRPVNPVEWWDQHWVEDRVERKLKAAGGV